MGSELTKQNNNNVMLEDVRLLFRNFAGKEGMYNAEGDRNFKVMLDPDMAEDMLRDGWNVKYLKKRDDDDPNTPSQAILDVTVGYKGRPPRVVMITKKGRTTLTEEVVELLDYVDIKVVDVIIRPYNWSVSGRTGVKAYLQSAFVTIHEDPLELKYSDVPEIDFRRPVLEIESGPGDNDIIDGEVVEDSDEEL